MLNLLNRKAQVADKAQCDRLAAVVEYELSVADRVIDWYINRRRYEAAQAVNRWAENRRQLLVGLS